jgi:hypothetical protein
LPSEVTDPPEDENENDTSKLKGIRYPGMGLFDAADEDQKKRRNQRKDDSVLKQMEEISSGIEPTECVWTEIGEFQRSRDIYATPSIEGSPVRCPLAGLMPFLFEFVCSVLTSFVLPGPHIGASGRAQRRQA